jgi:hypothetical protein
MQCPMSIKKSPQKATNGREIGGVYLLGRCGGQVTIASLMCLRS